MAMTFNIIPPNPWVDANGNPTLAFFQFITNLFNVTPNSPVPGNTIQSNITGGTAPAVANTLSAILDALIGSSEGDIPVRGLSGWGALALGAAGKAIVSNGTMLTAGFIANLASAVVLQSGGPATITTAGGNLNITSAGGETILGDALVVLGSATGRVQFGQTAAAATIPANFVADHRIAIKDGSGTTYNLPVSSVAW